MFSSRLGRIRDCILHQVNGRTELSSTDGNSFKSTKYEDTRECRACIWVSFYERPREALSGSYCVSIPACRLRLKCNPVSDQKWENAWAVALRQQGSVL